MTIHDTDLSTIERDDIYGNNVRVVLSREYSTEEKRLIKIKLQSMSPSNIRWMNMIAQINRSAEEIGVIYNREQDLFTNWISSDTKGTENLDVGLLRQLNSEIVAEGDELYSVESALD